MFRTAILAGMLSGLVVPPTAYAQDNCTSINFAPGHSSAVVKGVSPPDDVVCYTFAAAAGQTATLKVTGRNMVISVIGWDNQAGKHPGQDRSAEHGASLNSWGGRLAGNRAFISRHAWRQAAR